MPSRNSRPSRYSQSRNQSTNVSHTKQSSQSPSVPQSPSSVPSSNTSSSLSFISNVLSTGGGVLLGNVIFSELLSGNKLDKKKEEEISSQISPNCKSNFRDYVNCMLEKKEQGVDINMDGLCADELKLFNNCSNNNNNNTNN
jgi:hypothetical protein